MEIFDKLVKSVGLARILISLGSIPVIFILGFKMWLGGLGYLLLSPSFFLTLTVDLSQVVVGALLIRLMIFITLDSATLLFGKLKASVFGLTVQPYEEPLTESQQFIVNTGGTVFLAMLIYAPIASIYVVAAGVIWLTAGKFKGLADPSQVAMSADALSWNNKMLTLSLITFAWGFAYTVGYYRAEKLSQGSEVVVSIGGVEKRLVAMLPVTQGVIFFDNEACMPIFVTTSAIQYIQEIEQKDGSTCDDDAKPKGS